ncbi:TPA: hypothetical protein IAD52_00755 [Candidatus Spyradomonas excrementavium]|nr:hypothetical protein [Candidatus Spyradomonas excrementavium]
MYCCGERLRVTRLVFNTNGYYKRVDFGFCQGCGTAHTFVYVISKGGRERERKFSGSTAIKEFKKYQRLKNNIRQGTRNNQNVCYGDFLKTRKVDANGFPVYLQIRRDFNNQYEVLNQVETIYSTM